MIDTSHAKCGCNRSRPGKTILTATTAETRLDSMIGSMRRPTLRTSRKRYNMSESKYCFYEGLHTEKAVRSASRWIRGSICTVVRWLLLK